MSPALGVYIHWPFCARICPYCDFNVYRHRGHGDLGSALKAAILQDLKTQAASLGPRTLVSIFFGGGTPSLMAPEWVAEIIETCKGLWPGASNLEVTLEANPTDGQAAKFQAFQGAGINRLSLGLQALNDQDLKLLGRDHTAAEGQRAAQLAASIFPRLSIDLIYARPHQTVGQWVAELDAALELGAQHISPYQLTIEAGTAFERAVGRGRLIPPGPDLAADLYEATQDSLCQAGFEAYEVSNHARGTDHQSRHNLVYWQGEDYLGIGPGAHGRITRDGARQATIAALTPKAYIERVGLTGLGVAETESLSPIAMAEERLLSGLRILQGVAYSDLAALNLHPDHDEVRAMTEDGLLVADTARLRATPAGRLVLNWLTGRLALA